MRDERGTDLQALQDYLDGRLSSGQRSAFEDRLEREPTLRLDLESAQELRAALDEEVPDLSPGFYTRARARFKESSRKEQRWSFRLLSWETAGVAAAAALAAALFVPRLTQEGVPRDLGAVATETRQQVVLDEKEGLEEASVMEKKGPDVLDAPEPIAPEPIVQEPLGLADAESDRQEKLAAPGKKAPEPKPSSDKGDRRTGRDQDPALSAAGSAGEETRRTRIERDDDAFHAAAPAEAESAPPTDVFSEIVEEAKTKDEAVHAKRGKRAAAAVMQIRPAVVELPAGLVDRGQLRSVERIEDWVALLGGPHAEAIEMLGSPTPDRRLVLIGSRNGLACDSLTVTSDGQTHRIEWARSPTDREPAGGCALVLPHDGRTVTVAAPR